MDASIVVAIIALLSALVSAGISVYGQLHAGSVAARREAEGVLAKYREPLLAAAYDLQARLYNIIDLDFLKKYLNAGDESQQVYATENTLYVVAQYLGWSEILRREIQFLSFSDSDKTRSVSECQRRIVELFQSDDPALGRPFLLWRGEQRAIGERMIDTFNGQLGCVGYAAFAERRDPSLRDWLARMEGEVPQIAAGGPNKRLTELQHGLVDLIHELDPGRLRYADRELQKVRPGPTGVPTADDLRAPAEPIRP